MNQNNLLLGFLAVILLIFGIFVVSDLRSHTHVEPAKNWKWSDDWKSNSTGVTPTTPTTPVKPAEPKTPVKPEISPIVAKDYAEAIQKSKETGRSVLVLFTSTSCNWCEKLKKETLKDQNVKALIEKYIYVEVDVMQNRLIAKKFEVTGLPTSVITNGKEEKLKVLGGYKPAKIYEEWLNNPENDKRSDDRNKVDFSSVLEQTKFK